MKISTIFIPILSVIFLSGLMTVQTRADNVGASLSTEDTKTIFAKVLNNFAKIETFKTTTYNFVRGNIYHQKTVKEAKIAISTLSVVFQKPRRMVVEIKDSKDSPNLNKTRFYFDGGKNVKIKIPGIFGLFHFSFPITKPELSNFRGYNAEQIDTISLHQRLSDKAAKVQFKGYSKIFDEEVLLLEITNIKMLDQKLTREVIGVRKSDYIMLLHEMYEGDSLVYQDKFKDFKYNMPLTENDFKL